MLVSFNCTIMAVDFPEICSFEMYVLLSSPPVERHSRNKCDQGDCNLDLVCFFETTHKSTIATYEDDKVDSFLSTVPSSSDNSHALSCSSA